MLRFIKTMWYYKTKQKVSFRDAYLLTKIEVRILKVIEQWETSNKIMRGGH